MLDFIYNLNELSLSLLTILLVSLLTVMYKMNRHLMRFATTGSTWPVTEKINTLGRFLVIGGALSTFPAVMLLLFSPESESALCVFLAVAGYLALIAAIPVLIMVLVWRVCLSELTLGRLWLDSLKGVKVATKALDWKKVGLCLIAVTLLVFTWPIIQVIAYLVVITLIVFFSLLDGGNECDESEYDYSYNGSYYNHITGKLGYSYESGSCVDDD